MTSWVSVYFLLLYIELLYEYITLYLTIFLLWTSLVALFYFISSISFFLNLSGWLWLIKPYRFQVYDSVTHHLHTASCAHHSQSSLFLSPPFISPLSFYPSAQHPFPLAIAILLSVAAIFFFFLSAWIFNILLLFNYSCPTSFPIALPCPTPWLCSQHGWFFS